MRKNTKRRKRKNPKLALNAIKIHAPSNGTDELRYTKEFSKLQREWYGKLEADGFEDLEYVGHGGLDSSAAPLKSSTAPDQNMGDLGLTYHYYNLLSNFLTHNARYGSVRDRAILRLYVAGVSYRKILKHESVIKLIESGKVKPFSVFIVFQTVKEFVAEAMLWNKTNPEGLEYRDILDAAEDAEGGEA